MNNPEKVIKGLECCILRDPDDHARCSQCSYGSNCVNRLKMDALTLLKSQQERIAELETAQTARVMTLEEVKNSEVVYLEDYSDPDDGVSSIIRPAINVEAKNGGIFMLDSIAWDEGYIFNADDDYGKEWRCWTSRPTDAQQEAAKWS